MTLKRKTLLVLTAIIIFLPSVSDSKSYKEKFEGCKTLYNELVDQDTECAKRLSETTKQLEDTNKSLDKLEKAIDKQANKHRVQGGVGASLLFFLLFLIFP